MLILRKDFATCCFCETHSLEGEDSQHPVQKVMCSSAKEGSAVCLSAEVFLQGASYLFFFDDMYDDITFHHSYLWLPSISY